VNPIWEERLKRATTLGLAWPFAAEKLRFYRAVTTFQRDIHHQIVIRPEKIDPSDLAEFVPGFISMVEATAPDEIVALAQRLKDKTDAAWEELLRAAWRGPVDSPFTFFTRSLLQPYAMHLADLWRAEVGAFDGSEVACPFCGRAPQVIAVCGERREFVCSLCSTAWAAHRPQCARCREIRAERLAHEAVPEIPWMVLEMCESCGHRIKAVDVGLAPDAVPLVDDIAALPLEALARHKK
jgi:formate dehydrogenase maturation protein FdhE